MPYYVVEYVDTKQDIRSPITLFNYVRDFRDFFNWFISEGIAKCDRIKDITPDVLSSITLDEARNYFKFLARKKFKVSEDETKQINLKNVNRHKSSLRSLFKYMTVEAELENNEPYFHRNVMQKIEVTKVKETFNERAKNLTEKIFIGDKDIEFLDYIKGDYELSLSPSQLKYFKAR
jgi:site-specific recombinase XerD